MLFVGFPDVEVPCKNFTPAFVSVTHFCSAGLSLNASMLRCLVSYVLTKVRKLLKSTGESASRLSVAIQPDKVNKTLSNRTRSNCHANALRTIQDFSETGLSKRDLT